MNTFELLQHWSRLEPDRCEQANETHFHLVRTQGAWLIQVSPALPMLEICKARLRYAVEAAIVAQGLRVELNYFPTAEKWTVSLFPAGDAISNPYRHWSSKNADAGLALLEAYTKYLESQQGREAA
jgi:hypothetical protein